MAAFYGVDPAYYGVEAQPLADHLIANGVTFREHDCHWATEQAYKNGYRKGYADAIAYARRELNMIHEMVTETLGMVKELQATASRAAEKESKHKHFPNGDANKN